MVTAYRPGGRSATFNSSYRVTQRETEHRHAHDQRLRRNSLGGPQVLLSLVAPAGRCGAVRRDATRRDATSSLTAAREPSGFRKHARGAGYQVDGECRTRRRRRRRRDGGRKGESEKNRITSMIEGARRCRLEGRGDARVGEPDAQGQQPAE